ncbi:MAG: DUF4435 domain-containing protein, partial [Vampirovibrionales bacterium]
ENIDENVFFMEILHKLKNPKEEFYIFCVEGIDDKFFYSSYFKGSYGTKKKELMELIDCGGREKVEELLNLLKNKSDFETRFKSVLFFVDRDLNPSPSHERLFVTCGYSFENYLCNVETVYLVLERSMPIISTGKKIKSLPPREEILQQFHKQLDKFCREYFPIMTYVKSIKLPEESWVEKYKPEALFEHKEKTKWIRNDQQKHLFEPVDQEVAKGSLNTEDYSHYHIHGKYVLICVTWFIQAYLKTQNKDLIKERLISEVQSIPALDAYFKRHIKEAS